MTTSLISLAELWQSAERAGSLNPALVDYTCEETEDGAEFGMFLHWAWRADRWPGTNFIQTSMGNQRPKFLWLVYRDSCWAMYSAGVGPPFKVRVRSSGSAWEHTEHFVTARTAFEFLFAAWQKLTEAEKRGLWEAC